MSTKPPLADALIPSRRILVPVSFAGCGGLLLILLVVLIGCAPFGSTPGMPTAVTPNDQNAVLCECTCEADFDPLAVPPKNFVAESSDDGTQAQGAGAAALTSGVLELGQNGLVAVRFDSVGVPQGATIVEATIQFTAGATTPAGNVADLQIRVVDAPDVGTFLSAAQPPQPIDFSTLPLVNGSIGWTPLAWEINQAGDQQRTPDLKSLLQVIVNNPQYTPQNAVAFVVSGFGRRTARSFDGGSSGAPPSLAIKYQPKVTKVEFSACRLPNETDPAAVCAGRVEDNVSDMASTCKVAKACTCALKPADNTFSNVCNQACPGVTLPADCNPAGFAAATRATDNHAPVCIASSPLGSALFGQHSACDLDPNQSGVNVTVRDEDGDVEGASGSNARGRIEFVGRPCPDGSCPIGMTQRIHIGDITFDGGLFASDPKFIQLTGVGKSKGTTTIAAGTGVFGSNSTEHSARGRLEGEETKAFFIPNNTSALTVGVGNWAPGGVCTFDGSLIDAPSLTMSASLRGRLVNQPPAADVGPDQHEFQCNEVGRATFSLDGSQSFDPDNNVAYFGWYRNGRKGDLVGNLPRVDLAQAVKTTAPYVFKVVDTFGQYDEASTSVSVVDTIAPVVTAPPKVKAECTGPNGTAVVLGTATASDVCDASPDLTNNAPQTFPLGVTPVVWTATDESNNQGMATQQVEIVDTTPPQLTISVSPTALWPPNHKLVQISATITVQDVCDPSPKVELVSIVSNEPDNATGDGNTSDDIQEAEYGTRDVKFKLRAERRGPGNGRVYTVTYKATDGSGNATVRTAIVTVAHNQ